MSRRNPKDDKRRSSHTPSINRDGAKPNSLLLKLTPKLIKSCADLNARAEEDLEASTSKTERQEDEDVPLPVSVSPCSAPSPAASPSPAPSPDKQGDTDDVPDWYEELSDDHVSAFKEVFDMLDASNTGTLNADSLFEGLRRVDSEITRQEVEDVLKTLDKDGNGEIDFDEFLYHISHAEEIEGDDDDESVRRRRDAFTKRQRLFYTAITEFSLKRTLADIQRAQMARVNQPHVLSHYTAGARLIGLTDRQLAIEMKKMQRNMKSTDSPYAKPLQLVVSARAGKTVRKAIRPRLKEAQQGTGQVVAQMSQMKQLGAQVPAATPITTPIPVAGPMVPRINILPERPKGIGWGGVFSKIKEQPQEEGDAPKTDIRDTVRMLTSRTSQNIMSRLPDAHKLIELREKLAKDIVAVAEAPQAGGDEKPKKPKAKLRGRRTLTSCFIPRVDRDKVPLPVLKIKSKHQRLTIEDLPDIREKVDQAIDDYYENLRQATVKNAWDHWDKLYSHPIRSHKLMENFREVYQAYSPHKKEEAFVVCPWVSGPFRQIKHFNRYHTAGYMKQDCGNSARPISKHQTTYHAPKSGRSSQTSGRSSRTSGRLSCTSGRSSRADNRPVSAMC